MAAVASSTASDTERVGPSGPMRTCVGCRRRASAAELLRVVAGPDASLAPDPRRRLPGRGAWVHPVLDCVDLAERRRAFARALRVPGALDPAPVRAYLASPDPQEMKRR